MERLYTVYASHAPGKPAPASGSHRKVMLDTCATALKPYPHCPPATLIFRPVGSSPPSPPPAAPPLKSPEPSSPSAYTATRLPSDSPTCLLVRYETYEDCRHTAARTASPA